MLIWNPYLQVTYFNMCSFSLTFIKILLFFFICLIWIIGKMNFLQERTGNAFICIFLIKTINKDFLRLVPQFKNSKIPLIIEKLHHSNLYLLYFFKKFLLMWYLIFCILKILNIRLYYHYFITYTLTTGQNKIIRYFHNY